MTEAERTKARLLLTGAVGFIVAAEATHEREQLPGEMEHWPAICVNACYAFELSLKAFLASRGANEQALRKIGHDLKLALAEAQSAGYTPNHSGIAEVIDILSPLHKSHELRYLEDKSVNLPDTRNLIAFAHANLKGVGEQIPIADLG